MRLNGYLARPAVAALTWIASTAERRRARRGCGLGLTLFLAVLVAPVTAVAAAPRTIVFFGDSLTAGYGLEDPGTEAFPARIEQKISAAALPFRVVNAGLSGETSAGGLRRIDWILRQPIDIFVLELGANDGLRGIDPAVTRANLQAIIDKVRGRRADTAIVLAGMMMPPSMGQQFEEDFARVFQDLAEKNHLTFVPFLLVGVGGRADLNQPDGIHPTAEGHAVVAETIWSVLQPLLAKTASQVSAAAP